MIESMSIGMSDAAVYLLKAQENLDCALSELESRRYNSRANRCYYACFQAAIAAHLRAEIRASGTRNDWPHSFVQSQFAGQLVNRRHLFPSELRSILPELQVIRHSADYDPELVTEAEARRVVRRAGRFLDAIRQREGMSR